MILCLPARAAEAYIYMLDSLIFFTIIISWNMILSWERKGLHLLHLLH